MSKFNKPPKLEDFIAGSAEPEPKITTKKAQPENIESQPDKKSAESATGTAESSEKEDFGKNKTIFSQSDEDFEELRNYAFRKRVTKTSIIRKALKEYIENHP